MLVLKNIFEQMMLGGIGKSKLPAMSGCSNQLLVTTLFSACSVQVIDSIILSHLLPSVHFDVCFFFVEFLSRRFSRVAACITSLQHVQ